MSEAIENLVQAQQKAMAGRPKVGGFPYLAETLRQAGVTHNFWDLPASQSMYLTDKGAIIQVNKPIATGNIDVPSFNEEALITALRLNQAGESTFPEFLVSAFEAGVIRYIADFEKRIVTYYGSNAEAYEEEYPAVEI